jgi:hypothetical protein
LSLRLVPTDCDGYGEYDPEFGKVTGLNVILCSPETALDEVFSPAFDKQGGNRDNIRVVDPELFSPRSMQKLEPDKLDKLFKFGADIIVIDALAAHIDVEKDSNRMEHARAQMEAAVR